MPESDRNKLNRLEELKSKLFSKSYKTETRHRNEFSHPKEADVLDAWQAESKTEPGFGEKFFMKTSRFKKFFVFSVSFFVLSLAYAGFVFFIGSNTVSNDNIEISIIGNNFTAGGEELPLIIGIKNKNNASLELVDLVIDYPKGGNEDLASDSVNIRQSLGTIGPGEVRNENLKLVLFGEQGSIRPIKISLEYRVAGSNAIFVKEKSYEVRISSTPINLTVLAPSAISPNQEVVLNIKAALNATRPASKILVKVDYPVGFSFTKAVPEPSFGNNVWELGDLPAGGERSILVTGKMIDVFDGEEKTFTVSSGSQSLLNKAVIDVVYNSIKNTIAIRRPFIEATLFVNGVYEREYAVNTKTEINGEIRYANNLDTRVNDLKIEAKISGNAFDERSIFVEQGYYNSSRDTMTWDKSSERDLAEVNPGDSGSVSFSLSPASLFSGAGGILSNPSINIEVNISGKQSVQGFATSEINNSSSAIIRVISDVGFSAKALHYSGPFTNTGPIPPKAEVATTYTIVWTLTNTANSISGAKVSSSLPSWVNFAGPISPPSESFSYKSATREIVWNPGRIPKGAGIVVASPSVSFQVSLTPSLSQVGRAVDLINDAVLTAHDDFANVDLKVGKGELNISLSSDPSFPTNGGSVVP